MNESQLKELKELLNNFGFKFTEISQRITNFDNKSDKGEFVVTFQARFYYSANVKSLVEPL